MIAHCPALRSLSAETPSRLAARSASQKPTRIAVAMRTPYQRIVSGPTWNATRPARRRAAPLSAPAPPAPRAGRGPRRVGATPRVGDALRLAPGGARAADPREARDVPVRGGDAVVRGL